MSDVYITVDYFEVARRRRPPCDGCTPPDIVLPVLTADVMAHADPADLRVIGTSGGMNLCTRCARDVIKSIAARFMLYDRRSSHDLLDFFAIEAIEARKPAPRKPRLAANRMLPPPDGEVDVLPRGAKVSKSTKKGPS